MRLYPSAASPSCVVDGGHAKEDNKNRDEKKLSGRLEFGLVGETFDIVDAQGEILSSNTDTTKWK
jgi:hypothetical protein